jgi:hypothetical protein
MIAIKKDGRPAGPIGALNPADLEMSHACTRSFALLITIQRTRLRAITPALQGGLGEALRAAGRPRSRWQRLAVDGPAGWSPLNSQWDW